MTHRLIRIGRSLIGILLVIGVGVSTHGCGDTATVTEPAALGNLSVSTGDLEPRFSPTVTSYIVQLSTEISSTTITATPRVAGDTIRIDNQLVSSETVTLDSPGAEKSVNIVVTETGAGGTSKSYTVRFKRASLAGNNSLESLEVSPGTLAPAFDKNSLRYTLSVASGVGSVTITPTLSDPLATITVDGQPAISGQARTVTLNGGGQDTTITTTVKAQNGSTQSYGITVSRGRSNNNNLQGLTLSSGALNPTFKATTTGYTVAVGSGVESLTVRPTVADATARVTVNGQDVTSGQSSQAIKLNAAGGSDTIIPIIVIAQDGSSQLYTVAVKRAALNGDNKLRSLSIQPGRLDFKSDDFFYDNVTVGSSEPNITVNATKNAPTATVKINGVDGNSRQVPLRGPGLTTRITVRVTAESGSSQDYIIEVTNAALSGNGDLDTLTVRDTLRERALSPTFSKTRTRRDYALNVESTIDRITVNATPQDSAASVRFVVDGGGQSNPIQLKKGPSTTLIEVIVKAANGNDAPSYLITITRDAPSNNANLSALSVTAGSTVFPLSSPFDSNIVNVATEVEEVIVKATKDDENATMAIESVTVNPGIKSGEATKKLAGAGAPTEAKVLVTPQSGTNPRLYTIIVNRAAPVPKPAKPATPDLIDADDSCEFSTGTNFCFGDTSKTDNITNVRRPRFLITVGDGETPHLYVDDKEDTKATYDGGAKTMQPEKDLPEGLHTIRSTRSNAGGESPQSDALSIKIDGTIKTEGSGTTGNP